MYIQRYGDINRRQKKWDNFKYNWDAHQYLHKMVTTSVQDGYNTTVNKTYGVNINIINNMHKKTHDMQENGELSL